MSKRSCHWRRLASAKWEDAWLERLRFLGCGVATFRKPGSRLVRLEAWCDEKTARRLLKEFGGEVRAVSAPPPPAPPRRPLRVRGRFEVRDPAAHRKRPLPSGREILWIPAGTAFGTGNHATTATLLRMLCDLAPPPGFRAFDAGTGTGILAIAMEKLGAVEVVAADNDPAAVRSARAAFRLNSCRVCRAEKRDALDPPPGRGLITANLFSSLLVRAARPFARALNPGGLLLFSGVLRQQWDEVRAALEAAGLRIEEMRARGKWCAGAARATARKPASFSATAGRRRG